MNRHVEICEDDNCLICIDYREELQEYTQNHEQDQ